MNPRPLFFSVVFALMPACGGEAVRSNGDSCESLFNNDCGGGCACPKDYKCSMDSMLGSRNLDHCYKPCRSSSECPDKQICAAVEVFLGGPDKRIEGRCWAECSSDGSRRTCPEGGNCRSSTRFPEGEEISGCYQ